MKQLTPVPEDELQTAAIVLGSFGEWWENLEGDESGRHKSVKLIVEGTFVDE